MSVNLPGLEVECSPSRRSLECSLNFTFKDEYTKLTTIKLDHS